MKYKDRIIEVMEMSESQKRFEEWMLSLGYSEMVLSKYGNNQEGYRVGSYANSLAATAWLAWQEAEKQLQDTNKRLLSAAERDLKLEQLQATNQQFIELAEECAEFLSTISDYEKPLTLDDRLAEAITNTKQQELGDE